MRFEYSLMIHLILDFEFHQFFYEHNMYNMQIFSTMLDRKKYIFLNIKIVNINNFQKQQFCSKLYGYTNQTKLNLP